MGVEYIHQIIPRNPRFQATDEQVRQTIAVLTAHGIWGTDVARFSGENGKFCGVPPDHVDAKTDCFVISSGDLEGTKIAAVMGKSAYDEVDDDTRYVQDVSVTNGPGIKCHRGCEGIYVDATKVQVVENEFSPYMHPPFSGIIPDGQDLSLIRVVTGKSVTLDKAFVGWWKFSITIDCGKDLPNWTADMTMSNRSLITELSATLGIDFCEVGAYY